MMAIFQILLFLIASWLFAKLVVRSYLIYRFIKNFFSIANGARKHYGFHNTNGAYKHSSYNKAKANGKTTTNAKMVPCIKCQLYVPENESYFLDGKYYCCKEHSK